MKNAWFLLIFGLIFLEGFPQKKIDVPQVVQQTLSQKFPEASHVSWEMEKGNYEANWGGKSGEDNSVLISPAGVFIEVERAIPVGQLPAPIQAYVQAHYKSAKISEAGKVTDAAGKQYYLAEVNGKDLKFDLDGKYMGRD